MVNNTRRKNMGGKQSLPENIGGKQYFPKRHRLLAVLTTKTFEVNSTCQKSVGGKQ